MRRRGLVILCLIAAVGILYGSLMPFALNTDEDQMRTKIRWFLQQWPLGNGHVSRGDIIANVALYIPLGLLLALAIRPRSRRGKIATVPIAAALGLALSALVESSQLLLDGRVSSPSDLVMNTLGTTIGAILGVTVAPAAWRALRCRSRETWREDPLVLLGFILAALLVADALFPLLPTLDVGQVLRSIRRSALDPRAGWRIHPWHHWLIRRLLPWAAVSALLSCSRRDHTPTRPWRVAGWVVLLAGACEAGKLFIISRVANVTNVGVTLVAAVAGSLAGYALLRRLKPADLLRLAAVALVGYLAYIQWTPFTFRWSMELAESHWPRGTRWLPMYHYAMGARPEDVRLFLRSVSLLAAVVYSLLGCRTHRPNTKPGRMVAGALIGLGLGIALEAGQFFLPSRVPSTTDLFCMSLGGLLGGWLTHRDPLPDPASIDPSLPSQDRTGAQPSASNVVPPSGP